LQGAMALFSKYCKQSTPINVRFLAIIIRIENNIDLSLVFFPVATKMFSRSARLI